MSNLKCALDILEKNNYIEKRWNHKGFYRYWTITFKIKGVDFENNLLEKLKKENHVIIIDNFIHYDNKNSWIIFTTTTAITNGLKEIFEKSEKTKWKGPIHKNMRGIEEFIKKTKKYSINVYGSNDLGKLVEITDLEKKEEENNKNKKIENEANELLNKIL